MAIDDTDQAQTRADSLKALAEVLHNKGFETGIVLPVDAQPFLRVSCKEAGRLTENVICGPDAHGTLSFFYSWGDPISPTPEVEVAALRVTHILTPQGTG